MRFTLSPAPPDRHHQHHQSLLPASFSRSSHDQPIDCSRMCGIAGVVQLRGAGARDSNAVERMLESLRQRGPDDIGLFATPRMAMGIRRLSIIDLANGHQPISNEDGTVHVVMNGELYEYVELRQELMREGHVF